MKLDQLFRLRTLRDAVLFPKPGGPICDLSRDEANAISAAIDGMPNPRLVEALEAVLLFHSGREWDFDARQKWKNLTGNIDCTTRSLCDFIRKRLAEPFSEDVRREVRESAKTAMGTYIRPIDRPIDQR